MKNLQITSREIEVLKWACYELLSTAKLEEQLQMESPYYTTPEIKRLLEELYKLQSKEN